MQTATRERVIMFLYDMRGLVAHIDVAVIFRFFLKRAYPFLEQLFALPVVCDKLFFTQWCDQNMLVPAIKLMAGIYENK